MPAKFPSEWGFWRALVQPYPLANCRRHGDKPTEQPRQPKVGLHVAASGEPAEGKTDHCPEAEDDCLASLNLIDVHDLEEPFVVIPSDYKGVPSIHGLVISDRQQKSNGDASQARGDSQADCDDDVDRCHESLPTESLTLATSHTASYALL